MLISFSPLWLKRLRNLLCWQQKKNKKKPRSSHSDAPTDVLLEPSHDRLAVTACVRAQATPEKRSRFPSFMREQGGCFGAHRSFSFRTRRQRMQQLTRCTCHGTDELDSIDQAVLVGVEEVEEGG